MKKIILIMSFTLIALSSCSSDSNDNNSNNTIVGKWEYYKVRTFPAGTVITGNEELYPLPQECPTRTQYLQFGNQGSLKEALYDNNCNEEINLGTYSLNDFILNLDFTQDLSEMDDTWEVLTLNNSTLTIMAPNPTINPVEINVFSFRKIQ
jgi:hypothetical protein